MTTKEKIVKESLKLFSCKGYDGVSMREIASAVGIKGASIYNHFKGKEDIFCAIFDEMKKRYDIVTKSMKIPVVENDDTINIYSNIEEKELLEMAQGLLFVFCNDEFIVMFRKLLTSEQHKYPMAGKFLKQYYLEAPVKFQSQIFEGIQRLGGFKEYDAELMAVHFYSPIYYLICNYDLGMPYEQCLLQLRKHVYGFCKLYSK